MSQIKFPKHLPSSTPAAKLCSRGKKESPMRVNLPSCVRAAEGVVEPISAARTCELG